MVDSQLATKESLVQSTLPEGTLPPALLYYSHCVILHSIQVPFPDSIVNSVTVLTWVFSFRGPYQPKENSILPTLLLRITFFLK